MQSCTFICCMNYDHIPATNLHLAPSPAPSRAGALMATKWPSDMAYSPWRLCSARRSCHIFMPFLAHVCRECKSVEIFMFRTELATPTTRCRCRALNIAQKRLKSLGQGARKSGAGRLLVFYWMKWRAWRWFINVLQVQHSHSGAHESGNFFLKT